MRDSRRARLVLALLLLTAFTLITLDFRSGGGGPFRTVGNTVFGPIERAVTAVTRPIGSFFASLGHLNSYKSDNAKLRAQNRKLLEELRTSDANRAHLLSLERLDHLAGQAQFRIVAARVVAIGNALDFEWTATIDAGSNDGVRRNQTVINGDGLVGKTLAVGPTTSTIRLGADPEFTAGARLAGTQESGFVDGGGHNPMTFTMLNTRAPLNVGDRLVTAGDTDNHDRPFVPEVPIGRITRVLPTPGQLYRKAVVAPFVDFTSIDIVGVVVAAPRTVPRDSLLPPSPSPTPTPGPGGTGGTGGTGQQSPPPSPGTTSGRRSTSPSPSRTP
ncbi:MAG: rod shape-determining protein MreC [Frankiales bacterium]|nr:rod shape-determining protein MreC [Frankiales bacterium]